MLNTLRLYYIYSAGHIQPQWVVILPMMHKRKMSNKNLEVFFLRFCPQYFEADGWVMMSEDYIVYQFTICANKVQVRNYEVIMK